jgi:hypothetical protein
MLKPLDKTDYIDYNVSSTKLGVRDLPKIRNERRDVRWATRHKGNKID